jgi:hypothetical protein
MPNAWRDQSIRVLQGQYLCVAEFCSAPYSGKRLPLRGSVQPVVAR